MAELSLAMAFDSATNSDKPAISKAILKNICLL
jgi:hypothetical protein